MDQVCVQWLQNSADSWPNFNLRLLIESSCNDTKAWGVVLCWLNYWVNYATRHTLTYLNTVDNHKDEVNTVVGVSDNKSSIRIYIPCCHHHHSCPSSFSTLQTNQIQPRKPSIYNTSIPLSSSEKRYGYFSILGPRKQNTKIDTQSQIHGNGWLAYQGLVLVHYTRQFSLQNDVSISYLGIVICHSWIVLSIHIAVGQSRKFDLNHVG